MTCTPETEVIGRVMMPYFGNISPEIAAPLVIKYNLINIRPDQWYPLQPWLNFINDMAAHPDFATNMISVGIKVAEYATAAPRMAGLTLGHVLEGWDANFRANFRSGDVGHITAEKVNAQFYRTIHQHVYPDDINYGMLYGFAHAMLPKEAEFTVWYEDYNHRLDRGDGDRTVICVRWD